MESFLHLNDQSKKDESSSHGENKHPNPSNSDLMSSAKLVAEAAQSQFSQDPSKKNFDKGEVAGAAADLLHAASSYGKLEGKGLGNYVEKAENYLHQYNTSHSTTKPSGTTHDETTPSGHPSGGDQTQGHSSGGGGGYGDYLKMAEGFVKKQSGDSTTDSSTAGGHGQSEGGGYGNYVKMAEGFMKKQSGESHDSTTTDSSGGDQGGKYGDYMKMAEGVLKHTGGDKPSESDGNSGGGYGDVMKMAGDFLKKH